MRMALIRGMKNANKTITGFRVGIPGEGERGSGVKSNSVPG
jgi:hypothetical protein